jgi:hypothetical protein
MYTPSILYITPPHTRHNSSAPVRNASMYRSAFQRVLPAIFESVTIAYAMHTTMHSQPLRKQTRLLIFEDLNFMKSDL